MRREEAAAPSGEIVIEVESGQGGERLDLFLARLEEIPSRSQARRLIEEGRIRVNGAPAPKAGMRLLPGDRVALRLPPKESGEELRAEPVPLNLVYEDEHLAVVNKPRGMVVHPAPGHAGGTLLNALLHRYPELVGVGGTGRPGIVHRLDKETTGLLVVARSQQAYAGLVAQLKARAVERIYSALVHGQPPVEKGCVDAPIGRHPLDRKKMAVVERGGRPAVTHFHVVERFSEYALLEVRLETGRTHQIRVHMAHIGHPLAGDRRYGAPPSKLFPDGQALHAARLAFEHPVTKEALSFTAPLPGDFEEALRTLRHETGVDSRPNR